MIVNIASVGGLRAEPGLGVYNLTKAALIHLTRQLASELGPTRVVGIAPGLVQTDFAAVPRRQLRRVAGRAAADRRLGEPADIANLVTFLASDAASWITGETYVIDGGAGVMGGSVADRPTNRRLDQIRRSGCWATRRDRSTSWLPDRSRCPAQRARGSVTPLSTVGTMSAVVVPFPTKSGSASVADEVPACADFDPDWWFEERALRAGGRGLPPLSGP